MQESAPSARPVARKTVQFDVHDDAEAGPFSWLGKAVSCIGPGLMLGLANSNAGDLLAAAQSGAKYKFLYFPWIVLLVGPLYISTELVTRICVVNGKGLLSLISDSCGKWWAFVSVSVLLVSCMGGLTMQTCTFVAVGEIWGLDGVLVCLAITGLLIFAALMEDVQRMVQFGICFGLFECAFCVSAVIARPDGAEILRSFESIYITLQPDHTTITGAIIGAVLMPWMFFYQGCAVTRNKMTTDHLGDERLDIAMGSFVSQMTMGAILITFAVAMQETSGDLSTIPFVDIPGSLQPVLPNAKFLFSMGMVGACLVASLAMALTISWMVEEVISLDLLGEMTPEAANRCTKGSFVASVVLACSLSLAGVRTMTMIIFCDIVNSFTVLLIIVFILFLSQTKLPEEYSVTGFRKVVTFVTMISLGVCGLYSASNYLSSIFSEELEDSVPAWM